MLNTSIFTEFAFTVTVALAKPDGLTATPGNGKVILNWTDPGDNSITGYQIRYKAGNADTSFTGSEIGTGDWTNISGSSATTTSHTVTDLANGADYAFQIRAVNTQTVNITDKVTEEQDIFGPESKTVTAAPALGLSKPVGLTATSGSRQAILNWIDPGDINIDEYQIRYKAGNADTSFTGSEIGTGAWTNISDSIATTTSHKVTDLDDGTQYAFQIRSHYGTDYSSPSDIATTTPATLSLPSGFTAIPFDSEVELNWEDPADSSITVYQIRYKAGSGNFNAWSVTFGSATTTSYTVTGLANDTQYAFQIRAVDSNDDAGNASAIVTATPAVFPAPFGFTATPGNGKVELKWEDPADSSITGYQIRYKAGSGNFNAWSDTFGSATTTSYTVTGLANGTQYAFQVRVLSAPANPPNVPCTSASCSAPSKTKTATPRDGLTEILNRVILPEVARAMADQTVGAIGRRVAQARQATRTLEVGGQSTLADVMTTHGPALADGTGNLKGLLNNSAFVLPLQAQPGAGLSHLTLWGNGAYRNLGGEAGTLDWDGDLLSARLGVDARLGQEVLAGLAVAWQQSKMGYTQAALSRTRQGDYDTTLTSIHPYLGWTAPDGGLELWATAGYGWGDLTITDADRQLSSDLTAQTLGAGGSSRLWATETTRLRLKGEALHTQMDIDGSATLAAQTVKARRVRLALEGSRTQALAGGAQVQSSLALGLRHDAGDGRTGTGAEVGGGLSYTNPARRLTLATQARVLLLHGGDYEDWGISGTLQLAPGADGQGLAVRVQPGWGQSASRVSALWAQDAVAGLRSNGTPAQEGRVDVQVGYGVAWAEALVTPYGTIGLTTGRTRVYGLGSRLTLESGLQFNLEGLRQETAGAPVEHGVRLELGLAW